MAAVAQGLPTLAYIGAVASGIDRPVDPAGYRRHLHRVSCRREGPQWPLFAILTLFPPAPRQSALAGKPALNDIPAPFLDRFSECPKVFSDLIPTSYLAGTRKHIGPNIHAALTVFPIVGGFDKIFLY
jgi:hypothetical protein